MTKSLILFFVLSFASGCLGGSSAFADNITVAAAASLREAMTEIAKVYETDTQDQVELTFGSSGQLAAQIKAGAPIDAFISAADAQVKDLIHAQAADGKSSRIIAGNELVLVVPRSNATITSFEDLKNVKRLATGEPRTVPAGMYAEQTLKKLDLLDTLKDRIVYGTNVRQVLDYVRRSEVDAGIVYATDAKEAGEEVKLVATADKTWHQPIQYPAIVMSKTSKRDAAVRFLDFLRTPKAQQLLKERGFAPAPAGATTSTTQATGK